jgi:hypothetical protein
MPTKPIISRAIPASKFAANLLARRMTKISGVEPCIYVFCTCEAHPFSFIINVKILV